MRKLQLTVSGLLLCLSFGQVYGQSDAGRQEADLILDHATVVTMDEAYRVIENGAVVISDGLIVDIGQRDILERYEATNVLDVSGDIVMPGFVNTHTHLAMSVFRTLGEDIADRLHRYLFPLEAQFADLEMVRIGTRLGVLESIKGGTTTLVDMYYFEGAVAEVLDKAGLRGVVGETIMTFKTPDADKPSDAIQRTIDLIHQYKDHPRIFPAFAPHGPYTNSTETLREIAALSEKYDTRVTSHVAESVRESEEIAARGARSSVAYLETTGLLSSRLLIAHAILVDDADIALLKKYDVGVGHCVSANTKSAKGVAPVPAMLARGINVGLCTDGPMSGNGLSVLDELPQVGKIHKLNLADREAMPVRDIVAMATIGGARALGMEDRIGSLEVGKQADIIVVDTTAPNMTPIFDYYAALVYSALATNVKHMIVAGSVIMKDRQVLTMDEASVIQEAQDLSARIAKRLYNGGVRIDNN